MLQNTLPKTCLMRRGRNTRHSFHGPLLLSSIAHEDFDLPAHSTGPGRLVHTHVQSMPWSSTFILERSQPWTNHVRSKGKRVSLQKTHVEDNDGIVSVCLAAPKPGRPIMIAPCMSLSPPPGPGKKPLPRGSFGSSGYLHS